MKNIITLFILTVFIFSNNLFAQLPEIPEPVLYTPDYVVYMSPDGDDLNSGIKEAPVATFRKAMSLIPFSNSKNVYGDVVLLEGDYYPKRTFRQETSDYKSGGYTKNISLVGKGTVNLYGDSTSGSPHLIDLKGSHIRIENLNTYRSKGTGIRLTNELTKADRMYDIIVRDVLVDSADSHSLIATNAENVLFERVVCTNGQLHNTGIGGWCGWGSAIKAYMVKNVIIRDCKTYHNRGEGINTQACTNVLVEGCVSYDNFAGSIYCTRTNNAIYRQNLVFSYDSIYWRNCRPSNAAYQTPRPTGGISIANEVDVANGYDMQNNQSCNPARGHKDNLFKNKIADSIFIYNNIFIQANVGLNDESYGQCVDALAAYNNFSNIFIENNTFIGDNGLDNQYTGTTQPIKLVLDQNYWHGCIFGGLNGRGAYRFDNFVLKNNIISSSISSSSITGILYGGRPCNGGLLEDKITAATNLWHHEPKQIHDHWGEKMIPNFFLTESDRINENLLTAVDPFGTLEALIPSTDENAPEFVFNMQGEVSEYITEDFFGNPRNSLSNVGAIEVQETIITGTLGFETQNLFKIYPNPSNGTFIIESVASETIQEVQAFDALGRQLIALTNRHSQNEKLHLNVQAAGLIYLKIRSNQGTSVHQLIVQ